MRFDATPASDEFANEIVEQQGQALDYAEKLWKDYVVDGQKLSGENSLYAPVAANGKNAIDEFVKSVSALRDGLKTDGIRSSSALILLPIVLGIIALGLIVLVLVRIKAFLPRFAPRLAKRLGVGQTTHYKQVFFAKCIAMLESCGLARASSATPHEFVSEAAVRLAVGPEASGSLQDSLALLSNQYYRQRFGDYQPTADDEAKINEALAGVEQSVAQRSTAKR